MEVQPQPEIVAEANKVVQECVKLSNSIPTKKNRENRKHEDRVAENNLKFLNNHHSPEEKLSAISKKYVEIVDENKKFQVTSKQWEKRYTMLQREKDQTQAEYNKTVLLKNKLENLCRELQKQIKIVKEESLLKMKQGEERQRQTFTVFQNTLTDVTTAVKQNNEKNIKLRDLNLDLTEKFKDLIEQYKLRENNIDKITKQVALETELSEAKLAKVNLEYQAEKEKLLAEKHQLLVELTQYQKRCNELQATETGLRNQIAMYTDKYDEFQNALTKSSEVFGGFKEEMEKMSKKVEKQEKEALIWKQRWEKSHAAMIDMAVSKQQMDSTLSVQSTQLQQLQKLCRTMQAERTLLMNKLKENNIEIPPLPKLPPEPKPLNESVDKVDVMAANCAQLKQTLSQLQGQLDDLTAKKKLENNSSSDIKVEDVTGQKKSKKNKGKRNKTAKNSTEIVNNALNSDINTAEVTEDKNIESNVSNECKHNELKKSLDVINELIDEVKQVEVKNVESDVTNECKHNELKKSLDVINELIDEVKQVEVKNVESDVSNECKHNELKKSLDVINELMDGVKHVEVKNVESDVLNECKHNELEKSLDVINELMDGVKHVEVKNVESDVSNELEKSLDVINELMDEVKHVEAKNVECDVSNEFKHNELEKSLDFINELMDEVKRVEVKNVESNLLNEFKHDELEKSLDVINELMDEVKQIGNDKFDLDTLTACTHIKDSLESENNLLLNNELEKLVISENSTNDISECMETLKAIIEENTITTDVEILNGNITSENNVENE